MDRKSQFSSVYETVARSSGNLSTIVFNAMIVIDAGLFSLWLAGRITTPGMFAVHLFSALFLMGVAALLDRKLFLCALIEGSLCLLAGPLGTLVLLLARLGQDQAAANPNNLEDPLDDASMPVSPPDAIHEMHVQGRRLMLRQDESQSYADMLRDGDMLRQNEVISAISRNYEPEMYPTLSMALGSSNPALKVQAAAVFSKLRRTLGEEANDLLATDQTKLMPNQALEHRQRLLRAAKSGFVDAAKVEALMARVEMIEGLGVLVGARPTQADSGAQKSRQVQPDLRKQTPRLKKYSCGGLE